ncbi:MAG: VOC family protein [Paracoccaceae bacterium]
MLRFDHIAIGCATLEQGAAYMAVRTGLTVPIGGEHPLMGTHNLVMSMGEDTFFEVIAVNPSAAKPMRPRWFGLDDARLTNPRPHSWILNSDDLETDLATAKSLGIDLGSPTTLTRGDMTWRFAVREDGAIPLEGAAPMIMEWSEMSIHPATKMADLGARISSITLATPHASTLNKLLNTLGDGNMPIEIFNSPDTNLTTTLALIDGREAVLD